MEGISLLFGEEVPVLILVKGVVVGEEVAVAVVASVHVWHNAKSNNIRRSSNRIRRKSYSPLQFIIQHLQ